jgi:hypothetical protein
MFTGELIDKFNPKKVQSSETTNLENRLTRIRSINPSTYKNINNFS